MNILPWLWLIDVLALQNQYERLLCSRNVARTGQSLGVSREGVVIIIAVAIIRRSALRMTPHTILKNIVPHETTTCSSYSRIAPYFRWFNRIWIFGHGVRSGLTLRISDPAPVTLGTQPGLNRGVRCIRFVRRHGRQLNQYSFVFALLIDSIVYVPFPGCGLVCSGAPGFELTRRMFTITRS